MPNEFLLYPTGGHGYGLHCTREARVWPQAAQEWLHKIGVQSESMKEPLPINVFKNLQSDKTQTIIVYGTSLTSHGEWPKGLQKYFDSHFPGQVTFLNAAQSGEQSNWGVAHFQERVLTKKPDLVFIEFSVNDSATKHHISVEESVANLDRMVRAFRQQNPQGDIVLQTMNAAWDAPDEPSGKKFASDRPHLEKYYDAYRTYAKKLNLPLVDHYPNWLALQQSDEEKFRKWLPDGLHPIPEASLAVTLPAVEALLEKARLVAADK